KDEDDVVKRYREALHGGDAERGSRIFYEDNSAQCTGCHAVGGEGGSVGPDLSAIGDLLDRERLLASMVDPDNRIGPGFGSATVTSVGGATVSEVLKEETDSTIRIQKADGELQQLPKDDIIKQSTAPSAMFSMEGVLSKNELRDLVEFLSRQNR